MTTTNAKRVNVLVYNGAGTTSSSVAHAIWSLRRLLEPNYAVLPVTSDQILKEPWTASCALLVFPGGADAAYCRTLNGAGNRRIKQYVNMGGAYLGFCAGGYYGSAKCEFEVGKKGMEVVGERELAFFPGVCRGLAFSGFAYRSEAGAKAVGLKVNRDVFGMDGKQHSPDSFKSYYNGGGVFVNAVKLRDRGVEVLANFAEEVDVDGGKGKVDAAAIVYCKIGSGHVVLTGPHPEFSGHNLLRSDHSRSDYATIVEALIAADLDRTEFMRAMLTKLGLVVPRSEATSAVPSLSPLHLSAAKPHDVAELVHAWSEQGNLAKGDDGVEYIKGENDTFKLHVGTSGQWSMAGLVKAVGDAVPLPQGVKDAVLPMAAVGSPTSAFSSRAGEEKQADQQSADRLLDSEHDKTKDLIAHEDALPSREETPSFDHHSFFAALSHYHSEVSDSHGNYGRYLLYGQVVTSTQTMLEKNSSWLAHLPSGFVVTATTQTAGRGRGSNVWVSPPGTLMFSTVMRHPLALSQSAPVTFIQYIAALAIVEGIQKYDNGYEKLAVRLKWPNDIYAEDPSNSDSSDKKFVKIGGILVNSSYSGGDYTCTLGIGLNVTNAAPTTSLSHLCNRVTPLLPPPSLEKLLASILAHLESMYTRFCRTGFDSHFESLYYSSWLHTDQIVTLETEGGARARIKGITRDWGLLVAEELAFGDRGTGKKWALQSDSNSFDFFRGLVRRKM